MRGGSGEVSIFGIIRGFVVSFVFVLLSRFWMFLLLSKKMSSEPGRFDGQQPNGTSGLHQPILVQSGGGGRWEGKRVVSMDKLNLLWEGGDVLKLFSPYC